MENNHEWYSGHSEKEWYMPASEPVREPPAPPRVKARRGHPALKAAMIVVFVLALIAASVVAFGGYDPQASSSLSGPGGTQPKPPGISGSAGGDDESGGGSDGGSSGGAGGDEAPDLPDDGSQDGSYRDYRDYFSNFYQSSESPEGSSIPRARDTDGRDLVLYSSESEELFDLGGVYDRCIDSIVGIRAAASDSSGIYWGTGVVMSSDGYIITNAHIISGTNAAVVITSDGAEYDALLVGEDARTDLAVLKIEARGLQAARFGISDELEVGDEVVAIGNPLGEEFTGTLTNGIISGISREVQTDGHIMTLLQTNAALNEGNSGGALINMYGQVVGITNMKMVADITSATIEGIGFAIPSVTVKEVVDQLIDNGEFRGRPMLGVTLGVLPEADRVRFGLPKGLYVVVVEERSDAYKKDIRVGDIVTAVNGTPVTSTDVITGIRDGLGVGDTITLTIYRGGDTFDVTIELVDALDLD